MAYAPPVARDAPTPPNERRLTLVSESSAALHDGTGAALCRLPCTAWVPSHAGWTLWFDVDGGARRSLEIPDDLADVPAGASATVVARPKRGHSAAATALILSGIPLSIAGGVLVGASLHDTSEKGIPRTNTIGLALGIGLLAVGIPMIVGGGAWSAYSQPPSIEVIDRQAR